MLTKYKIFSLLIFVIASKSHPFTEEVKSAVKFLKQEKSTILQIKNTSNTEGGEALSIAFPELLRWSAFSDLLETTAVELIYVEKGTGGVNFSIGHFQMKPSFIEQLETYISTHDNLKTVNWIVIDNKAEKECRKERIERLKQFAWQVRYAHIYWLVAQDVFKHRVFKNNKERVRFFATAYNYGFLRHEKEIEERLHRAIFPFGVNYKGEQVPYGDLSVEFFNNYAKEF